jgi:hypothetical protein
MDYFTKWPEVYIIHIQEALKVAKALVTNLCRFGVPWELHSDQGHNFRSCQIQEVLECLGVSRMPSKPLDLLSDDMVKCYIRTVEEHIWKVITSHQRDLDVRLPIFLLAYRASTYDTTGFTPASLVFRRELWLPCDLLFGSPPDKEQPTIDHAANLLDHLHDIHSYAHQHLKLASDRMKTRHNHMANSADYQESN